MHRGPIAGRRLTGAEAQKESEDVWSTSTLAVLCQPGGTGTKQLAFVGIGDCNDVPVGDPFLSQRIAIVPVSYEDRIRTTRSVYFDRGTGQATVAEFFEPEDISIGQRDFREILISSSTIFGMRDANEV